MKTTFYKTMHQSLTTTNSKDLDKDNIENKDKNIKDNNNKE